MTNLIYNQMLSDITTKGYVIIDDFLSSEQTQALATQLKEKFEIGQFKKAGIGKKETSSPTNVPYFLKRLRAIIQFIRNPFKQSNAAYQQNDKIRGDYIHWLNDDTQHQAEQAFLKAFQAFVDFLNQSANEQLTYFEFHYALYPKGTFYRRHLDQFKNGGSRRYSVVCYLNNDWTAEDGGALVLYLDDQDKVILPKGGRLVCFESGKLEHEVKVAHRERLSLTGWLRQ